MTKSTKYIIAVVLLLGANLWLFFSGSSSPSIETQTYFTEKNLDNTIKFHFATKKDTVDIELADAQWVVNDRYLADQNFVNTLISIFKRVEIGRSVGQWEGSVLGAVEVFYGPNSSHRFQFASNPTRTKSYFIAEGEAWEVGVPGYRDQVIDMFELHPDQWRNRLVFDGNWRTIQKINVQNQSGDDFIIAFKDDFFSVDDRPPVDSSAVVGYLNQFQDFTANEMISQGRFPAFDSLLNTVPMAIVQVDDIKYQDEILIKIFPSLSGQRFHLVEKSDSIRMVIDSQRVRYILTNPDKKN